MSYAIEPIGDSDSSTAVNQTGKDPLKTNVNKVEWDKTPGASTTSGNVDDTVKISTSAKVHQLKEQGQDTIAIAASLGITKQEVLTYLGISTDTEETLSGFAATKI